MTTPAVYHSLFGKRFGIQPASNGQDQLVVNGTAVTSAGSSETATLGNITQAASSKFTMGTNGQFIGSASAGITAFSGGGSASAVAINALINDVATVAATSDSVQLPGAVAGLEIAIFNSGANTLAVFPKNGTTDIINALTSGASFALGTSRMAWFTCTATGKWKSQSAAASS